MWGTSECFDLRRERTPSFCRAFVAVELRKCGRFEALVQPNRAGGNLHEDASRDFDEQQPHQTINTMNKVVEVSNYGIDEDVHEWLQVNRALDSVIIILAIKGQTISVLLH